MTALAKRDEQLPLAEVTHEPQPVSLLAVIERAARDNTIDVTKMERLVALYERTESKQAERAFNEAMNDAQTEIRPVTADAKSDKGKYASYQALDTAVRLIYTKHGFSLSFDTGDSAPDFVKVLCYVAHRAGHSRTYKVDMPADGKGAKGNDVMTKTHAAGSAMTYGQRYLLKLIFNIPVGDDDNGKGAGGDAPISGEQLGHVRRLIEETNSDVEKFCNLFKIDALPDLPRSKYDSAITMLNTKAKGFKK